MEQRISVIVPAYNCGPWLERCLDSLLAQTWENLEVIVVNDGSTDDSKTILDEYAEKHPKVRVFHKENGGVTSARLRGIAEATGQWIGFVDGDDTVEPWMYAQLLENALDNGADISHCGQQIVFPDGRVTRVTDSGELRCQSRQQGLYDLLDGGTIESGLCTKLCRAELFRGLDGWMDLSIKHNEDLLMNFYLFSGAEKSVFQAICPYHYILRTGSASYRVTGEGYFFDQLKVRQRILDCCGPDLEIPARQAQLRNGLFLYGCLATCPKEGLERVGAEVRGMLLRNKAYFDLLSTRNRILANMICRTPWLFRGAYRLYLTLTNKQEEH